MENTNTRIVQPNCSFCKEIEDHEKNILSHSRIVLETDSFVCFPTVGCYQVGYLLIMPKSHYLCFGELNESQLNELNAIIQRIEVIIKERSQTSALLFEHGTRDVTKGTATSIMHAHIHIMPFFGLFRELLPKNAILKPIISIGQLRNETDNYLYFGDTDRGNYILEMENKPSQYFRQISCASMGMTDKWDWHENPFTENMEKTIDYYHSLHRGR
jgi:diadenosine tetraphosphate (Ap4A) HIT family hydrolase